MPVTCDKSLAVYFMKWFIIVVTIIIIIIIIIIDMFNVA